MAKTTEKVYISFAQTGIPTSIGPTGDYELVFKSQLALRYVLVDGEVVDKYPDLSDKEVLEKILADNKARDQALQDKIEAEVNAKPYELYKTDVVAAMNDEELDAFDAQLAKSTTRERRMWADCTRLVSTEPYFGALLAGFKAAFGEERGAALLARR